MVEPRDIYLVVNDVNRLHNMLYMGYTCILCTEDELPADIMYHPLVSKASVMLPPYACVSLESDRQFDSANSQYWHYLSTYRDVACMCNMIYIAALICKKIVLYLGSEFNDLTLIQNLPTFFANILGIGFGTYSPGWINTDTAPRIIATEYLERNFDAIHSLSFYPKNTDFPAPMLDKLIEDMRPPIQPGDYQSANAYFRSIVNTMDGSKSDKYGNTLYCPFTSGYGGGN